MTWLPQTTSSAVVTQHAGTHAHYCTRDVSNDLTCTAVVDQRIVHPLLHSYLRIHLVVSSKYMYLQLFALYISNVVLSIL